MLYQHKGHNAFILFIPQYVRVVCTMMVVRAWNKRIPRKVLNPKTCNARTPLCTVINPRRKVSGSGGSSIRTSLNLSPGLQAHIRHHTYTQPADLISLELP